MISHLSKPMLYVAYMPFYIALKYTKQIAKFMDIRSF